jgi:hypothetical protein
MAGYFPAVPHTAIRNDFCRLYLIIEYRPVLMMYGFEYALLGAHLGAAGDAHVECILGNVDSQYASITVLSFHLVSALFLPAAGHVLPDRHAPRKERIVLIIM